MSREHGILFQDAMVCAILDGRKDVTRRTSNVWAKRKPGDRLWVRECWALATGHAGDSAAVVRYRADGALKSFEGTVNEPNLSFDRWRPSIHMPRWASRLTLEVVSIDVEPGAEIDIKADGPEWVETATPLPRVTDEEARREGVADRAAYLDLWRAINGDDFGGVVWRIEFRVLSP